MSSLKKCLIFLSFKTKTFIFYQTQPCHSINRGSHNTFYPPTVPVRKLSVIILSMYKSPIRDREVMIVGDRVDATFIKLFYATIKLHQVKVFL